MKWDVMRAAAVLLVMILLAPSGAYAGRRYGGGGFFLSVGGVSVSGGHVLPRGGRYYGRHVRHHFVWPSLIVGTPGFALRIGSGTPRWYRSHVSYGRPWGRYGHSLRFGTHPFPGSSFGFFATGSGTGAAAVRIGSFPGFSYGRRGYWRAYPYTVRPYYASGWSGLPHSRPATVLPYTTKVWVAGRMTGRGYQRGHWEIRSVFPDSEKSGGDALPLPQAPDTGQPY